MKNERVRVCPVCNSTDVCLDFSNAALVRFGGLSVYRCNHCGNTGQFFPEIDKRDVLKPKDLDSVPKHELVDKTLGKNICWWNKIVGPVFAPVFWIFTIFLLLSYKDPVLFYIGLYVALPEAIIVYFVVYKWNLLKKNNALRKLLLALFVFSLTLGPVLSYYSAHP